MSDRTTEEPGKDKPPATANGKLAGLNSRDILLDEFALHGLDGAKLARRLNEALDAERTVVKFNPDNNRFYYSKPLTDHPTRLAAIREAFAVIGAYPDKTLRLEADALDWAEKLDAARERAEAGAKRRASRGDSES